MMHFTSLAVESPLIISIVFMVPAIIVCFAVRVGYRPRTILLLAASFLAFCVYFALLAISAGPDPYWKRGDMAFPIRYLGIVAAAFLAAWSIVFLGETIRYNRRRSGSRLVMLALIASVLLGCTVDLHVTTDPTPRPVIAPFVTPTPFVSPLAAPESPLPMPMALTPDVRPYTDALPMPGTTSGTIGNTQGD